MIYAHGKWLYGEFALVARDAARRFMFGRSSSSRRRSLWGPVVLRWRRRRKRQANLPTARAATPGVVWFPQFHFHYATHRNERTQRGRESGLAATTGIAATRLVVDRHWTSVRAAALPWPARRAYGPLRPFYARRGSRRNIDAGLMNTPRASKGAGGPSIAPPAAYGPLRPFYARQGSRRNIDAGLMNIPRASNRADGRSIAPPAAYRSRPLQSERLPEVVRGSIQREEGTPPFLTRARIWQHWLQIFQMRSPTGARVPDRSQPQQALRVQFERPEELVWRRIMRPSKEVAEVERRQELSDSFQRPALRTFQSQEAAPVSATFERTAAPQITKLDPSFLDRLTDDVIRRVEQRARIERQRRGL